MLGGHRSALVAGLSGSCRPGRRHPCQPRPFPQRSEVVAAAGPLDAPRLVAKAARCSVPVQVRGDAAEALGFEDPPSTPSFALVCSAASTTSGRPLRSAACPAPWRPPCRARACEGSTTGSPSGSAASSQSGPGSTLAATPTATFPVQLAMPASSSCPRRPSTQCRPGCSPGLG